MQKKDTLESFIEKLLEDKQFKNLEPEVYAQLKEDLIGRAEDQINAALLTELSPSDLEKFENLVDEEAGGPALQDFLTKHVKDIEQVVAATLIRFHDSYLGPMQ